MASTLVGGFLLLTAAVGLAFNLLLASAGRSVMSRFDARLHGIGTAVFLAVIFWTAALGLRLGFQGRGSLAAAGRALGVAAVLAWILFAVAEAFVLVPMW